MSRRGSRDTAQEEISPSTWGVRLSAVATSSASVCPFHDRHLGSYGRFYHFSASGTAPSPAGHGSGRGDPAMRLVIARCSVDYTGRLSAHLPGDPAAGQGGRLGAGAPRRRGPSPSTGCRRRAPWSRARRLAVTNRTGESMTIQITEILHDSSHDLGVDPGLVKDGVERPSRSCWPTAAPPSATAGRWSAASTHRHRTGRPPLPRRPGRLRRRRDQAPRRDRRPGTARPLPGTPPPRPRRRPRRAGRPGLHLAGPDPAAARGINCVALDYDALRGMEPNTPTLF